MDSDLQNGIDDLRRGAISEEARNRLATRLYEAAIAFAGIQHRLRGSPDGVAGASDLANSRVAAIMVDPVRELGSIETAEELEQALHRMLKDSWIKRRRKAGAKKRGGHMRRVTNAAGDSQDESDGDFLENTQIAPPTSEEIEREMKDLLSIFPEGSEERAIVLDLIEGRTQTEIGERLGRTRHSVGRLIRNRIGSALRSYWRDDPASDGSDSK